MSDDPMDPMQFVRDLESQVNEINELYELAEKYYPRENLFGPRELNENE